MIATKSRNIDVSRERVHNIDTSTGRGQVERLDYEPVKRGSLANGEQMHILMARLWPFNRSITGDGVRKTLAVLKEYVPLKVYEVPTGTKAFDWEVPSEWACMDATLRHLDTGQKFLDFKDSNLHVVGYSEAVDMVMSLEELAPHIHTLPEQPDAIPYVTRYYSQGWGLCMRHDTYRRLPAGEYHVKIDSALFPGSLTYAELVI